jgi:hypothetical protein
MPGGVGIKEETRRREDDMHGTQKPRRTLRSSSCLFVALAGFGATLGGCWYRWEFGCTVHGTERMLDMEGPRFGSTREEVEAWLNFRRIRHEYSTNLGEVGDYPAGQEPRVFCGLSPDDVGGYVRSMIPAWWVNGVWDGEIWIYFFFDWDGRLLKYAVKGWEYYL